MGEIGISAAQDIHTVIEVDVELLDVLPRVHRRFTVPAAINLHQFHYAIQAAMGWENRHRYVFDVSGVLYGEPDPQREFKSGRRMRLFQLTTHRFLYSYDFGDDWNHTVTITAPRERLRTEFVPRLMQAEGNCPPEDVGGSPGYANFLEVLANPRNPEHLDYLQWVGGFWDPVNFPLEPLQYGLVATARRGRWVLDPLART